MKNERDDTNIPPALAEEHNDLADLAVQLANDELPAERAAELRKRLQTDPVFRAVAEPILEAWKEPPLTDAEMAREWPEFRALAGIQDLEQLETRDDPELHEYARMVRERSRAAKWRRVTAYAAMVAGLIALPLGGSWYMEKAKWRHIETTGIETSMAMLPDSTRVTLAPESKLSYRTDMSATARRTVKLRGRMDYEYGLQFLQGAPTSPRPTGDTLAVRVRGGGGEPLQIVTGTAHITPFTSRGTVITYADSTVVVVHAGTVLVNALDEDGKPLRQTLRVETGERARIHDGVVHVRQHALPGGQP